ncbi:MAG: MFS transporter, partial [Xanthomonadales bacterium]|nr:MFS transporter [Xanthomonadales bacterium]
VPVGIVALLGVLASVPKDEVEPSRFDWRGFAFLAVGIAALQLMLDRGNEKDWFSSIEIQIDLALAFLGFYLYWVHWRSSERTFVNLALLRDRNFGVATLFIFIVGVLLFATMALMPPYLQNLMNYPVVTTGLLLAPRGVGTLVAMTTVGRLLARGIDPRLPMATGIVLIAVSLGMSAQFGPDVPMWPIINVGVIQGLGLGLVFVPVSTLAYATLPGRSRTEAAGIFSLARNIGSSFGISIMFTLIARGTQLNHAELASRITPYSLNVPGGILNPDSLQGLAALNAEVTRQAAAIAYINDFWLMMWLTLGALPFLLLFRIPRRQVAKPAPELAIDH